VKTMTTRTIRMIVALFTALMLSGAAWAETPEVLCELSRDRVYLGESVGYRVTLNHVENPSPPELAGFDDFDVKSAGTQNLNSTQITIINGQRSEVIRHGQAYDYVLTPRRAGLLTVPAPIAQVDGEVLQGRALALRVVEPDLQDDVLLEISASPESVYPTERLTITLSVLVRGLPGELSDRNPLSVQSSPPALTIPWADDQQVPDGLEPIEDAGSWLSQLRDLHGEGFAVNGLVDRSAFSLFERRPLTFQPRPRRVTRNVGDGEKDYWLYEFKRSFRAKRAGDYTFGPATLKGTFAVDRDAAGRLTGDDVYATASPLTVEVKQVPDAGRPADYLGVIGKCTLSAELKPAECRVGDPVTLTLVLRGSGSLDAAAAPDLASVPGVAEHFKTYSGTREVKGDTCRFTYTLRPLNSEVTEFPSISGSYFDVSDEKYVTLHTDPLPMSVSDAPVLADRRIVGGGPARTPDELHVRREGIFANITDPRELRDESVHPEYWLAGAAVLAALYAVLAGATAYVRRRSADPAMVRRRAAVARAKRRLHEGTGLLRSGNVRDGTDEVRGAMVGLIADAAGVAEAGMTSAEACRRLGEFDAEPDLVDRLRRSLETCDAARYAPTAAETNGLAADVGVLFENVVETLKKQRRL